MKDGRFDLASPLRLTPAPTGSGSEPCVVAFYLPQYHPTPENDEWWGPGFTDWANVVTAQRQYPTHNVPNIPADLGFYDLRLLDTRQKQGALARQYGIYGFCYYFYWFSGRRLLNEPLDLIRSDGQPDLPFCVCWANEPWSRRWDGSNAEVLVAQHHDVETDVRILDDLMGLFLDPRYIRVDDRPLLLVYRAGLLQDKLAFTTALRAAALDRGLPGLFLCNVMSFGDTDESASGFDAAVEFPPHNIMAAEVDRQRLAVPEAFQGRIYDYADLVRRSIARVDPAFRFFPGVMPRWDNTPRKGSAGHIFHGSTPELFEAWVRRAASTTVQRNPAMPLLFINSWNEWGEGAHLEPDRQFGRRYLEAVRRVAAGVLRSTPRDGADADYPASTASALVASLEAENRLLLERLAEVGRIAKDPPLAPGLPPPLLAATRCGGGVAWVDSINGDTRFRAPVIVRRDLDLSVVGWFFTDPHLSGSSDSFSYFLLEGVTDQQVYCAVLLHRISRPDVRHTIVAGGSRMRRRAMRVLSRVHWSWVHRLLSRYSRGRDRLGFEARLPLLHVAPGIYKIVFAEAVGGSVCLVDSAVTVNVVS